MTSSFTGKLEVYEKNVPNLPSVIESVDIYAQVYLAHSSPVLDFTRVRHTSAPDSHLKNLAGWRGHVSSIGSVFLESRNRFGYKEVP